MRQEVRLGGFGGQGIILAGYILGKAAALYDGKEDVFTKAYGAEAGGGACSAELVISDEAIDYPMVSRPDLLVLMSQEAFTKYGSAVAEGAHPIVGYNPRGGAARGAGRGDPHDRPAGAAGPEPEGVRLRLRIRSRGGGVMSDSVLVIGGGIAGVQGALDLAEAGAQVVLVEKGPSIGGKMAALDKNFPTLDCSVCIEAPKLSEVGAHPNTDG